MYALRACLENVGLEKRGKEENIGKHGDKNRGMSKHR